ncbi:MAG: endopeptidase La [Bacteroidota bacterium]|nr:endopeptidase La [Bacteroidota bacterium]
MPKKKTPRKNEDDSQPEEKIPDVLPFIPLRDVVIFPHMLFPILVGRESSVAAVTEAVAGEKLLFVATQKNPLTEEPIEDDVYLNGTVVRILQVLKLPNGLMKVLVDGLATAKIFALEKKENGCPMASLWPIRPQPETTTRTQALTRHIDATFAEYVKLHRSIPDETLNAYENLNDPQRKLYYAASVALLNVETKQSLLESPTLNEQLYQLARILRKEIELLKMEREIDEEVQSSIQKTQRKYIIQEQIRMLRNELQKEDAAQEDGTNDTNQRTDGEDVRDDEPTEEYVRLLSRFRMIKRLMTREASEKAKEEFRKLRRMSPLSPEATVSFNYLDWLLAMPWRTYTQDNYSIRHARWVLDHDHYGLEKTKERILEHIAVINMVGNVRGQILCFVGPPGVGKTSLGRSIARALNRSFARISLGGIHDEAEIRGHRRTYIGSRPGKIIQAIRKAGSSNPVLLLDEIDKLSEDFQGDPASALLEVLDPEQNHAFSDHYLEVDFDLSRVFFITTANVRYNIPPPLQDRMEIIELPGYLEHEKVEIAKRHLIPKQLELHGLKPMKVRFKRSAITKIIREYTLEAGVRNLEREIASVCRKISKREVESRSDAEDLRRVLELIDADWVPPPDDDVDSNGKYPRLGEDENAFSPGLQNESDRETRDGGMTERSTEREDLESLEKLLDDDHIWDILTDPEPIPMVIEPNAEDGMGDAPKTRRNSRHAERAKEKAKPEKRPPIWVTPDDIRTFLGIPRQRGKHELKDKIGSVIGLAWTSVGGDILHVDVTIMPGMDKFVLTGQLGEVMKESAHAALSFLRSHAESLGLPMDFAEKKDIHIHMPEGAIPKDGPSAGLAMALAILSAARKSPARSDVAMTGEITLHGDVLPIGGLTEKLLAARRYNIRTVIIPKANETDLDEVPVPVRKGLHIIPVEHISEAIPYVFERKQHKRCVAS